MGTDKPKQSHLKAILGNTKAGRLVLSNEYLTYVFYIIQISGKESIVENVKFGFTFRYSVILQLITIENYQRDSKSGPHNRESLTNNHLTCATFNLSKLTTIMAGGYGTTFVIKRSWVRIPVPDTG